MRAEIGGQGNALEMARKNRGRTQPIPQACFPKYICTGPAAPRKIYIPRRISRFSLWGSFKEVLGWGWRGGKGGFEGDASSLANQ